MSHNLLRHTASLTYRCSIAGKEKCISTIFNSELSQIFCNNPWKTLEISRYHHSKYFFIGETILILTDAVYDRHTFFICFLRNLFCNIFPVSCCTEIQNHFLRASLSTLPSKKQTACNASSLLNCSFAKNIFPYPCLS